MVCDRVRKPLLYSILQGRNIPNLLLTVVIKIYDPKEIKIKLYATLTQPIKVSIGI